MHNEDATVLLAELENCRMEESDLFAKVKYNYVVAAQVRACLCLCSCS
jgi:hypothetical protein